MERRIDKKRMIIYYIHWWRGMLREHSGAIVLSAIGAFFMKWVGDFTIVAQCICAVGAAILTGLGIAVKWYELKEKRNGPKV